MFPFLFYIHILLCLISFSKSVLPVTQIESELSLAYLHIVCAGTKFHYDSSRLDFDSIDATIKSRGRLTPESKRVSAQIEVQLKATVNWKINDNNEIPFSISAKNYNDLRAESAVPRILILLCLPPNEKEWINHSENEISVRNRLHWMSLKGAPDINTETKTIYFPKDNILSSETLLQLMIKASNLEDL